MVSVTPARAYFPGMGEAVADRTVNRKIFTETELHRLPDVLRLNRDDPNYVFWRSAAQLSNYPFADVADAPFMGRKPELRFETWAEVSARVALGNSMLEPRGPELAEVERGVMEHHLRQASLLMSGRHLQHGDETQPTRNMEVFTNCSTAPTSFLLFYLLLNGSGVGRCYDDEMMVVDWSKMPTIICAIDDLHDDVQSGRIVGFMSRRNVEHFYVGAKTTVFEVPDSREGWAKAIEVMERMAFEKRHDEVLILDFSKVRPHGKPIAGMQNRPSSGPGPLMSAITNVARIRDAGMAPWRQAMYVDHYLAECVLVGGARRAARMATKHWLDKSIFDFIAVKRGGFLWSANDSVTVDYRFRMAVDAVHAMRPDGLDREQVRSWVAGALAVRKITELEAHAYLVMIAMAEASYFDGTGEPGMINQDRLVQNNEGMSIYAEGEVFHSNRYQGDPETGKMMRRLTSIVARKPYKMITNPCGEITLMVLGGYCVIADVVPFHAKDDDDAEDAFRAAVRALMRTNLLDCLYGKEVRRTNRIGVGMTGFHEWVYDRFGFTWHDIVDEEKSKSMWLTVSRFKRAVADEARRYAADIDVTVPHTNTTFKPAGTTSKLFGLTEGAHLPAMREYIRWVQFRNDDPLVNEYEARGYPVKRLRTYEGTTIVGFPTKPLICGLGDGKWVVTASEATPEEQYQFLRLMEKYWIRGVEEDGVTPLPVDQGNQVSYTLKYDREKVSFERFLSTLIKGQFSVRACSVMPQEDTSAYEYQPEQPVTKHEFEMIADAIAADNVKEDVGFEHVDCATGACPVDFNKE